MNVSRAFTLRELFVVIFVIALLLGLFLLLQPHHSAEPIRRAACVSNLKQFGIALMNYHDQLKTFPPGGIRRGDDPTQTHVSVHALLLPYFEEVALHNLNDPAEDWLHQKPQVATTVIPIFVCPSYGGENPFEDKLLNDLVLVPGSGGAYTQGQKLGITNYAFCTG